jgi:hypothetical protein
MQHSPGSPVTFAVRLHFEDFLFTDTTDSIRKIGNFKKDHSLITGWIGLCALAFQAEENSALH